MIKCRLLASLHIKKCQRCEKNEIMGVEDVVYVPWKNKNKQMEALSINFV